MFKTLSIITAQALMFVSLEAVQNARTQGSDDTYQWLFKDDGSYTFSGNFSQGISGDIGKGVIGIYSTTTNTYTLKTNSQVIFTSISNTSNNSSKPQEAAYGFYTSGDTTLTLEQSSTLTFQSISSANSTSYGIYALKEPYSNAQGMGATIQQNASLVFSSIQGENAYGFWSHNSYANIFNLHKDGLIKFGNIIGQAKATGLHSGFSSQDTFQGFNNSEGGIISFDNISAEESFVVSIGNQNESTLSFNQVRVYYGDYAGFDSVGNRSALCANIDNSRNGNLIYALASAGLNGKVNTALITTDEGTYNSFTQKGTSRWLIAPSTNEVYGMHFSSSSKQKSKISIGAYSTVLDSLILSTEGFGVNTQAKSATLIYASGNLELDLSKVSFASGVDHTTQGASVALSSGKSAGVIVGASDSQNPTTINFNSSQATFASIKGKEAYGLVLQNNAKANISNLAFGTIAGSDKSVGIAFEGNASLSGDITFANTPSTALQIHSGVKASILGSIVFKNPQTSTSLIDNQGGLDLLSSARLTFGTQPNDLENQIAEAGIRNVYDSGKIQLNLGNTTIQTQAQDQTHQAYGIFTSSVAISEILLDTNKTLTFNVYQKNGNEGTAFGRGKDTQNNKLGAIHLTLSQNSNLIFNSNAGELDSLSGSNANISLVGNKSRNSSSSLQLRSLSVEDFKLSSSTITLFASQEANISSNGFAEGKAYNQDQSQAQKGGSDRIMIGSNSSNQTLNNTLALTMDTFSKSQTYAILAQVGSGAKDTVVFNNLKNGESTTIKAYAGFESADITLKRTDSNGDAYYYIDFSPQNIQVNQDYIAPTISAMLSNYTLYLANFNSLNKRMGELRDSDGEQGVWARVFGGELSNEFGAGSTNYYATTQAGYDYSFALSDARDYLGVSLAYIYSNNQVNSSRVTLGNSWIEGEVDSKTQGVEFGIYNSYIQDSGLYTDSIFKFAYLSSSFELFNQAQDNNIDNLSLIVSQEVGYRYDFASVEGLYLTPSVEVAFGYLSGANFSQTLAMSNQTQYTLNSHQDDIFITRGKIEATLGYFFATDFGMSEESVSKRGASLYLGLGYEYDYVSGGKISYKSTQNTPSTQTNAIGSDGRVVLNLGTNLIINDDARVYFDFESNFLGKINKDYQLNAGVRISLGKVEVKKDAEEGSEAPLKIQ